MALLTVAAKTHWSRKMQTPPMSGQWSWLINSGPNQINPYLQVAINPPKLLVPKIRPCRGLIPSMLVGVPFGS